MRGDEKAVKEFYCGYEVAIRKYLMVKLPVEAVDEVLQDVFIGALESLPLFRGEAKLKSWLLAIARHEVADFYRKRYLKKAVEITGELFEGTAEEKKTPEWAYRQKEVKEAIKRSMKKLKKSYREVLYWRFEVGLSVKEVASRMNLGFKATESLLYRARKAFAVAYEDERNRLY